MRLKRELVLEMRMNIVELLSKIRSSPISWLACGAAGSLLVSVSSVELLGRKTKLIVATWPSFYAASAALVVLAIAVSFKRHSKKQLLATILSSYLMIIFIFAGIYYSMVGTGDYNDAVRKYDYYRYEGAMHEGQVSKVGPMEDGRPFAGTEARLWSGVDWLASGKNVVRSVPNKTPSVEEMLRIAEMPVERVVKFQPEARFRLMVDCFHFSVTTMTTLGYGDIYPRAWYAKIASDVQVLTGLVLLVVAVGMLFGSW